MTSRTRVAVVVDAEAVGAGALEQAVADIASAPSAELCAVVVWSRGRNHFERFSPLRVLLNVYRAFDRRFHPGATPGESAALQAGHTAPLIHFDAKTSRDRTGAAWRELEGLAPDVIASQIHDPAVVALASVSKQGIWWCGPIPVLDEDMKALHELSVTAGAGREPVSESIWQLTAGSPQGLSLQYASTRRFSNVSVEKNKAAIRSLRPSLWAKALKNSASDGSESGQKGGAVPLQPTARESVTGFIGLSLALAGMGRRQVAHRLSQRGVSTTWQVGLRRENSTRACDPEGYSWIEPEEDKWLADPTLVNREGRTYLFVEEFCEKLKRGRIVCAEVYADGRIDSFQPALEEAYHLSYPHVFEHAGEMFMIPESGAHGTVDLYQAVDFPHRWRRVRTLFQGAAFDTTVLKRDDRFWFFTSLIDDVDRLASRLMLFSAKDLDGTWEAHPANPVTMDARYARCAGAILSVQGGELRPVQDCSERYGGSMRFCRIEALNRLEYREVDVGSLGLHGQSGPTGPHTYSRTGDWESIDRMLIKRER